MLPSYISDIILHKHRKSQMIQVFVQLSRMGSSHGGLWQRVAKCLLVGNSTCKHRNPNSTLGGMFRDDYLGRWVASRSVESQDSQNHRAHAIANTAEGKTLSKEKFLG